MVLRNGSKQSWSSISSPRRQNICGRKSPIEILLGRLQRRLTSLDRKTSRRRRRLIGGTLCVSRGTHVFANLSLDTNDYKDGNHNSFLSPDNFASYLIGAFDELYHEGKAGSPKMMSIGLHARLVGRPGRLAGLRKFIEHAKKHDGVWFATREEIADHWAKVHPYKP